jgi:hypothetical protein
MVMILRRLAEGGNDEFPTFSAMAVGGMTLCRRGTRPSRPGRPGGERTKETGEGKEKSVFRAIADVLRQIGGAIATVVTLPFRALARLFGGASSSTRSRRV